MATTIPEEDKLRIPSSTKMAQLTELIQEDEDHRFPRIKLNRDKPRYELPNPTRDDRDNVDLAKTFKAIVLVARQNFFQDDESKKKGEDPKEKRALYVLRLNKVMPELIYVNPTSLKAWQMFVKQIVVAGQSYYAVVCEFGAEQVSSKKTNFVWNKMTFKMDRSLTRDELEHVQAIRELVDTRVKAYEDDSDLAKYEEEALGIRKPEPEEEIERHSKTARQSVEDEDEEDPTPKKPGKKKSAPTVDEDDETPPPKKKKPPVDEEDEEPTPKKKETKAGYPSLDDDDDEDLTAVKKKKPPVDDEEEEEPTPKKKKAPAASLDDDDED